MLVWKHGHVVKLWRHKQRTPNTNDHHMTLNQKPPWKFSAYATDSDAFWKFSTCEFYKTILGAIPRFVRPKTKLFAVKLGRILEVLCLQDLQKRLWVQFHALCAQKQSCLPWNSDAFWKVSAYTFYRKCSRRNSRIGASKSKAVCREIQTHSGSSLPASFTKSCRRNSTIFVLKNEVVCCVIQAHFGVLALRGW